MYFGVFSVSGGRVEQVTDAACAGLGCCGESTGEGVSVPILTHDHELLVTESKNTTEAAKVSLSVCT